MAGISPSVKKLSDETDKKLAQFAFKIYGTSGDEDFDQIAKQKQILNVTGESDDANTRVAYRGTVFSSHLTNVHRHLRGFRSLLANYLQDNSFPFSIYWVKELLGLPMHHELDEETAHGMLRDQATRAKTSSLEEGNLRTKDAYTELEDSIMSHLTSIFLMISQDQKWLGSNGVASGLFRSASPMKGGGGEGKSPKHAAASFRAKQTIVTEATRSASFHVAAGQQGSQKDGSQAQELQKTAQQPNTERGMINLGISRVVCRPGTASAKVQPSSSSADLTGPHPPIGGQVAIPHSARVQTHRSREDKETLTKALQRYREGKQEKLTLQKTWNAKSHTIRSVSSDQKSIHHAMNPTSLGVQGIGKEEAISGTVGGLSHRGISPTGEVKTTSFSNEMATIVSVRPLTARTMNHQDVDQHGGQKVVRQKQQPVIQQLLTTSGWTLMREQYCPAAPISMAIHGQTVPNHSAMVQVQPNSRAQTAGHRRAVDPTEGKGGTWVSQFDSRWVGHSAVEAKDSQTKEQSTS